MALDVQTIPGYVFVSCEGKTVIIAGVIVPPPGAPTPGSPNAIGVSSFESWFQHPLPPVPPKIGGPGRGISAQVVSLAVPGVDPGVFISVGAPALDNLLGSKSFGDFARAIDGSYTITVAPKSHVAAENARSEALAHMAPSLLMKYWSPDD